MWRGLSLSYKLVTIHSDLHSLAFHFSVVSSLDHLHFAGHTKLHRRRVIAAFAGWGADPLNVSGRGSREAPSSPSWSSVDKVGRGMSTPSPLSQPVHEF